MIRQSVRSQLRQWAEPIVVFTLIAALTIYLLDHPRVSGAFLGFALLVCAGLGIWLANAVARARLRNSGSGVGIVLVDEGRIGHFGPDSGGFVDIDALSTVRVAGPRNARYWELVHDDGPPMHIRTDARDADQLVDYLASLNGVTPLRIANALNSASPELIWRRS